MNSENTFGMVQQDVVFLELIEEDTEVLVVFLGRTAKDNTVV
jgi:hypothetical protein